MSGGKSWVLMEKKKGNMRKIATWVSSGRNTHGNRVVTGSGRFNGNLGLGSTGTDRKLIEGLYAEFRGQVPDALLKRAVVEAEALAWTTSHPLLFLPGLAEEKVSKARQWVKRQQEVHAQQGTFATAE